MKKSIQPQWKYKLLASLIGCRESVSERKMETERIKNRKKKKKKDKNRKRGIQFSYSLAEYNIILSLHGSYLPKLKACGRSKFQLATPKRTHFIRQIHNDETDS